MGLSQPASWSGPPLQQDYRHGVRAMPSAYEDAVRPIALLPHGSDIAQSRAPPLA
jgi:hypothetical protein